MLTFAAGLGRQSRAEVVSGRTAQQIRGLRTKRSKLFPNRNNKINAETNSSSSSSSIPPRAGNVGLGLQQRGSGAAFRPDDTPVPAGGLDEMFGLGRFAQPAPSAPASSSSTLRRIPRPIQGATRGKEVRAGAGGPTSTSQQRANVVAMRRSIDKHKRRKARMAHVQPDKPKYLLTGRTRASGTMGGRFPGGNIHQPHLGKFPDGPPPAPVGMPRGLSKKAAKRYRRKEARAHKHDPQWRLKKKLLARSMSPLGGVEDEDEVIPLEDGLKIAKVMLQELMPSTWKSKTDTPLLSFEEAAALLPKRNNRTPYLPTKHIEQVEYDPDFKPEEPVGPEVLAIQEAAASINPERALALFEEHEAKALADDRGVDHGGVGIHPQALLASARALIALRRPKEARDLVEFNVRGGKVRATSQMLETVVNGLLSEGHRHQALVFARTMMATHKADWAIDATKLEVSAFTSLISLYKENHLVEKGLQVLDFATEGVAIHLCPEETARNLFHSSIDACASKYQFAHIAYDLLVEMEMAAPPSALTYTKVLGACRTLGDVQKAEELWLQIEADPSLTHTRAHYNQMLHVLARLNWQTNRKKKPAPLWLKYTAPTEHRVTFTLGDEVGALALAFEGKPLDAMPTQAGNIVWDKATHREVRRGTAVLHETPPAELAKFQEEVAAVHGETTDAFIGSLQQRLLAELPSDISSELVQIEGGLNDDYIDDEEEDELMKMIESDEPNPDEEEWSKIDDEDLFGKKMKELALMAKNARDNDPDKANRPDYLATGMGEYIVDKPVSKAKQLQLGSSHNVPGLEGWLDEHDGGDEAATVTVAQLGTAPVVKNAFHDNVDPMAIGHASLGGRSGSAQDTLGGSANVALGAPSGSEGEGESSYAMAENSENSGNSVQTTQQAAEFELEMIWSPAGLHEFPTYDLSHYREKRPGQIQRYAIERAEALMNEMVAKGMKPTTDTINARIEVFAQAYRMNRAEQAWEMFEEYGVVPNEASYFAMVRMFKRSKRMAKAEEYFERMIDDPNVNIVSGRILCELGDGMARMGRTQKATELLEEAVRGGYHPREAHLRVLRFRLKELAAEEERKDKVRAKLESHAAAHAIGSGGVGGGEMLDPSMALSSKAPIQNPDEDEHDEDLEIDVEERSGVVQHVRDATDSTSEFDDDEDVELGGANDDDDDAILLGMNQQREVDPEAAAQWERDNAGFSDDEDEEGEGVGADAEGGMPAFGEGQEGQDETQPTHVTSSMEFAIDAKAMIQERLDNDPDEWRSLTANQRRRKILVENREKERLRRIPRANLMVNRKRIEDPATGKIYIYPKGREPKKHKNHLAKFLWWDFSPPKKRPYNPMGVFKNDRRPQNNQFFER
jgi:tetratricopeptide (TPR) repeat protein